jgi:hypothetical protein
MDDETAVLFAKRFNKFFKKRETSRRSPHYTPRKVFNKGEGSNQVPTCYECRKPRHMKMECPMNKGKVETQEKRFTKGKKGRRAYIAWDGNDMESTEESESEEANLYLMANLNEDNLPIEDTVNDYEPPNYSFDELQDAYNELHEKSMIIAKELAKTKKEKGVLNDKIDIQYESKIHFIW